MRKPTVVIAMLLSFCVSSFVIAEPYADKVQVTSSTSPMSQMMIKGANIPDRALVEIPAYPGARIFQTREAGEMTMNDEVYKTLAYIKLLSTDPVEKIVAWYKEQLGTYTYEDVFGVSWVFWKGEGEFNGLDMRQRTTIQNVGVSETIAAMEYDKDMKGVKSVIEVTYE